MGGYLANFTVYTMAMTGLICFAVFVYKKVMDGSIRKDNSKFLCVEDSMNLNPLKTLHVVRAGNERFLIASDVDRTTLISKLDGGKGSNEVPSFDALLEMQKTIEPQIQSQVLPQDVVQPQMSQASPQMRLASVRTRPPRRKDRSVMSVDFPKTPARNGRSPMREMAKRINEL